MILAAALMIGPVLGKASALTLPVNTVAPVVTGVAYVDQVLSTTTGTWAGGGLAYTYQWQRSASNIGGATASTYTVTLADEGLPVRCVVTATNTVGAVTANSNSIEQWVPSDMPAAKLWFDAWDTSTMAFATGVSSWTDRITGLPVTQATGATQPIYSATSLNGRPSVTGSGTQLLLTTAHATLGDTLKNKTGANVVILYEPLVIPGTSSNLTRFATSSVTAARLENRVAPSTRNTAGFRVLDGDTTQTVTDNLITVVVNQPAIEAVNLDYAVADQIRMSPNGTRGTGLAITSAGTATSNTDCAGVSLFGNTQGTNLFNARIAAVILSEQSQTSANEEKAEGYLAHRWALTSLLPGGHPFKTVAPTP